MNYKIKSLVYLFAFILSALLYYQVEERPNEVNKNQLPELTMQEGSVDSVENPPM
ncbi:MAG: hypothetical protein P8X60_01365 [Robiginitalea sp.]|jgi:hypothetical protein